MTTTRHHDGIVLRDTARANGNRYANSDSATERYHAIVAGWLAERRFSDSDVAVLLAGNGITFPRSTATNTTPARLTMAELDELRARTVFARSADPNSL